MKCNCGAELEVWKSVKRDNGEVTIYYRCGACKHETSEVINAAPVFKGKKDSESLADNHADMTD